MKPTQTIRSQRNCRGMTLVEVLVAAFVIATGLMGVAALQVTALQGASNADYRSRATDLAASLADRMRANLPAVDDYASATAADCDTIPAPVCAMTLDPNSSTTVASCSTQQMAIFDLWEVRCRNGVQTSLPGGQMTVACIDNDTTDEDSCSELSPLRVTITWRLQGDDDATATEQVVTTVIPGAPWK
ncbi:MAG: type IV pilus modification protein PilV [Candidatus Thiodiazotropha sp. (ex Epidulcina cf. delphinae)]|nr:type IV pilus modification protein PilV [Candidatus Thiodiazotropha sp. (ex Epidulcina cf. delphinae)]